MLRKLGLSSLAIAATIGAALAGGAYSNFPIVGIPADADCQSYGNGGVCNQYRPAGPSYITGNEIIPADTQLPSGQNPQTVDIPVGMFLNNTSTNALIGGDFSTNLWQRGTTPISATTAATAAYSADRWFAYSSGNTLTISKQTGASDISLSDSMLATMRVLRPSGTDVTQICVGQVLPQKDAARFLGKNAVFSFYALAPATLLSTNKAIDVSIAYATVADSATPNTVTDSFAKSTSTGYTAVVTKANAGATTTSIASGVATIPLTTGFVRYFVSGTIPTTATSVGVKLCMTPAAATTGVAGDYFEFGNAQLEATAATTSTNLGVIAPSPFSKRFVQTETALQQSYSYGLIEATGQFYNNTVLCASSGNAQIGVSFPSQMRMAPTVAVSAGGWSVQTAAAVTAIGTTTLVSATAQQASLTSGAACTATLPYVLKGTNTTGLLMFSAEP